MDAQQRLLLERSWETLQHNAFAEDGHITSVIVGIGTVDYTSMASHLGVGIYVATGGISLHACLTTVWQTYEQLPPSLQRHLALGSIHWLTGHQC